MSRADQKRQRDPVSLDDVLATWPKLGDLGPAPDGTHIVYEWQNALWAVDRRGKVRRLTDGMKPRWSPTSAELAYLDGDPLQVWVRDPHGNGSPRTDLPHGVSGYTWFPESRYLAVLDAGGERRADEGEPGRVRDGDVDDWHRPAASP